MAAKNIVLVGFMGTGKTSVGKILGKLLHREVIDIDEKIEKKQGQTIRAIFEKLGQAQFRCLESEAIREAVRKEAVVITTGGGAVMDPDNRKALKETGHVVALSAAPETILKRVEGARHRPLLTGPGVLEQIKKLLAERKDFYDRADYHFETDHLTAVQVAEKIMNVLKDDIN